MFHGDIHNRWFDKAISVAVYPNGLTGANVEHSHLDATVRHIYQCHYYIRDRCVPKYGSICFRERSMIITVSL